ncbi:peptidase S41 family protein [Nannizzia gypsea CBS 118893]|uniref:Peptidase S41 family protein n=1 Tax=Arthroderma gypseum (strain ATCC MYA-4604 / CBS 118893) TaxID=535722 RepID=E4UX14_ARTGP|nr:peptidase S41 family protein [Nannizzia gypsea CBS 118893]EFR02653.1 peptidase S41 family protein [Nannizzia gypsea CBS 118893]
MGWLHNGIIALTAFSSIPHTLARPSLTLSKAYQRQEPCEKVSLAQKEQLKRNPDARTFIVTAELAYSCLTSVPFKKEDAVKLIDGLDSFFSWQSTIDYLPDPPKGYLLPGVDLEGGLREIRDKATGNKYANEYEFQSDLTRLAASAHDGHFDLSLDAISTFTFLRDEIGSLVSVSPDGKKHPEIYIFSDLNTTATEKVKWKASAIKSIDGQDAVQWLQAWSYHDGYQDPDALYNSLFHSIPRYEQGSSGAFFGIGGAYTGPNTTITFENGTTREFTNYATFQQSFTGVVSGDTFYDTFCNGKLEQQQEKKKRDVIMAVGRKEVHRHKRGVSGEAVRALFPKAVEEFKLGDVAGYFLDGDRKDTAVLSINSFSGSDKSGDLHFQEFSSVITRFLAACKKEGKSKLIIDVTANGGGAVFLGYDVFKQLFPNTEPNDASNLRATEQLNFIGSKVTALLADPKQRNSTMGLSMRGSDFDIGVYIDTKGDVLTGWNDFFGPEQVGGFNFTQLATWNLKSEDLAFASGDTVVAGYLNRINLPPPVFKPEEMILLTDGTCSSTCAIFADLLKRNGVKSVVTGGRPRDGPVQAVGGVKGSQVLTYLQMYQVASLVYTGYSTVQERERLAKTSIGEMYRTGEYVLARTRGAGSGGRVNFRNAVRPDDRSRTPRQFVNEPADCRLWMTQAMLFDMNKLWRAVYDVAWGDSSCTPGSTS